MIESKRGPEAVIQEGIAIVGIDDCATAFDTAAGGVLAEGLGPETVAMAVLALSGETDVAAGGDFFFEEVAVGPKKIQGSIGFGWVRMGSIGCAAHKADRAAGESPVTGETNARVVIADVCRSDSAYASSAVNVPSRAGQAS